MNKHKKFSALFVGVFFPTLLFVFSPMWSGLFKSTKSLEFHAQYVIDLSNRISGLEKWEQLEIKYQDTKLISPQIVGIKFSNDGDIPIERADFDSVLNVIFDSEVVVIGKKFVSVIPESISLNSLIQGNKVVISPTLLNPGDSFTLELLIDGSNSAFKVSSRISGISDVKEKGEESASGIYVHKVTPTGISTSTHTKLLYLPISVLVGFAFICFFGCAVIEKLPKQYERLSLIPWGVCLAFGVITILLIVGGLETAYSNSSAFNFSLTMLIWLTLKFVTIYILRFIQNVYSDDKVPGGSA